MNRSKRIVLLILALLLAFGIGNLTSSSDDDPSSEDQEGEPGAGEETYTCPMHPQIRQEGFGTCPICHMDLVPARSGGGGDVDAVQMSEGARRLARVQNGFVEAGPVEEELRVFGRAGIDENAQVDLTAWTAGRIERLYVNAIGEQVRRGQLLAKIYSPELLAAQRNLILANRNLEAARQEESERRRRAAELALDAAKTELRLLGMSARQVEEILQSGEVRETVDIFATAAGTVRARQVSEGDYVSRGDRLLSLAALEQVWIQLEIFERDLPRVSVGTPVVVKAPALGPDEREGQISFISPEIDEVRRVAMARVVLENPEGRLRPGMYLTARLALRNEEEDLLSIPRSAVLWTGRRSLVYVYDRGLDPAGYIPREVILGPRVGDRYVIEEGLQEGEEIAIKGAFRIDASLQVQGGPTMMSVMHGSVELEETVGRAPKVEVPEEGVQFSPPIDPGRLPEGVWYCEMGTTHWAQPEKGDDECPICGMRLTEKTGHHQDEQHGGHDHVH